MKTRAYNNDALDENTDTLWVLLQLVQIMSELKQEKMDEMNKNLISFEDFVAWHTANGTDQVDEKILRAAYEIYESLYIKYGKEIADEKICGHPVWNMNLDQ